jgi:hypothetical protein
MPTLITRVQYSVHIVGLDLLQAHVPSLLYRLTQAIGANDQILRRGCRKQLMALN